MNEESQFVEVNSKLENEFCHSVFLQGIAGLKTNERVHFIKSVHSSLDKTECEKRRAEIASFALSALSFLCLACKLSSFI